jgi:hypothetical protein
VDTYLTVEQVEDLDARTWVSRGKTAVTPEEGYALIKEVRRLRGENAMLTDAVVGAAALWFAQIDSPLADYASESLHEMAADLVRKNPRLAGSFRPEV